MDARSALNEEQTAILEDLNNQLAEVEQDTLQRTVILKKISGAWYEMGRKDIAGYYAEEVAKIEDSALSWSITGTTYSLAVQNATDDKVRQWASPRAVGAFENASSLEPYNMDHKINLALTYIDNPSSTNPMKGILMLRELNESDPKNVKVINQLARLAIQTNQFERAIERLQVALRYEPDNRNSNCLLVQAYESIGKKDEAEPYKKNCIK
jgi:cytochrome c-type biogenesis protein CcmH/NrfG